MSIFLKVSAFIVFLALTGCGSSVKSAAETCSVSVPTDTKSDKKAAAEAAVDLKDFARLPLTANFKAELSQAFTATFQKVPDSNAACAMLNQAYVCISDRDRASQYLDFMKSTNQCTR